jgi:hypothetical protein
MTALLRNAQQAGVGRPDIGVGELTAVLVGASRAVEQGGEDPATRARILAEMLDGLRSPAKLQAV